MRRTLWITCIIIVLLVAALAVGYLTLIPKSLDPYTPRITDEDGNVIPGSISLIETFVLGDVAQTITIRGVDRTNWTGILWPSFNRPWFFSFQVGLHSLRTCWRDRQEASPISTGTTGNSMPFW